MTEMEKAKACLTFAMLGKDLAIAYGEFMNNPTVYKSIIGALQYLIHNRPNLAFNINKLSQFLQKPTMKH